LKQLLAFSCHQSAYFQADGQVVFKSWLVSCSHGIMHKSNHPSSRRLRMMQQLDSLVWWRMARAAVIVKFALPAADTVQVCC